MRKRKNNRLMDYIQTRLVGYQIDIMAIGELCASVESLVAQGKDHASAVDEAFQALMNAGKLVKS